MKPLATPDGRYLVVRGRLWRAADPRLSDGLRAALVDRLMVARREVGAALRAQNGSRLAIARSEVNATKVALGERGAIWWTDSATDFNRCMVQNTPYAEWYCGVRNSRRRPSDSRRSQGPR